MGFVAGSSCFLPYQFPLSPSSAPRKFGVSCCVHQRHDPMCSKRAVVLMGIAVLPFLRLRNAPGLETPKESEMKAPEDDKKIEV